MARKKKIQDTDSGQENATNAIADEAEKGSTVPAIPARINSEDEAIELVRNKYKVPAGIKAVFVTEDGQVFYRNNTSQIHARQNNLKRFIIRWD